MAGVSSENKTSVGEEDGNKIISETGKLKPARIELSETKWDISNTQMKTKIPTPAESG